MKNNIIINETIYQLYYPVDVNLFRLGAIYCVGGTVKFHGPEFERKVKKMKGTQEERGQQVDWCTDQIK